MRPAEADPQTTGATRSRVVRQGVATLAIGALCLGLTPLATRASSAAPVPQPTYAVDQAAMGSRVQGVRRDAARVGAPPWLAILKAR